jgi:pimeloyl-ACP methyl ester carboxylesterase
MATIEPVIGKYIYFEVQGVEYRVYFEESGRGIPLVCQHTVGTDSRQWRHILNDSEVAARYRIIVPDLPYHGKSLPPESVEWWKQEYRLTQSFFMDFHVALIRALSLPKPVYIGSSMGGHLACDLALNHPDKYRAVIGLEASLSTRAPSSPSLWLDHPRISNEYRSTSMFSFMAPQSPEKNRREAVWLYMQSAPSVVKGDGYYYFVDHDLTEKVGKIDTSKVAVYLLTGDYDPSVTIEDTRRLAKQIKGARFTEMAGLGHFPMSENYPALRKYLMPVLSEIAGK